MDIVLLILGVLAYGAWALWLERDTLAEWWRDRHAETPPDEGEADDR